MMLPVALGGGNSPSGGGAGSGVGWGAAWGGGAGSEGAAGGGAAGAGAGELCRVLWQELIKTSARINKKQLKNLFNIPDLLNRRGCFKASVFEEAALRFPKPAGCRETLNLSCFIYIKTDPLKYYR
jgi:hypothetical protein